MTKSCRGAAVAGAIAAALCLSVAAIPALGASAPPPRCLTAQLRLVFVNAEGGVGHRYEHYAFRNIATKTCSLYGYPGVTLLDAHGHALGSPHATVTRWTVSPRRTVVIKPGQRAFFTFTWLAGDFCPGHAFTFSQMRVYPPGATRSIQRWHGATSACDDSTMVSAVRPKLLI